MTNQPTLKIDGAVQLPQSITYQDLTTLPASTQVADVSQLDPSRKGHAVRLQGILDLVQANKDARFLGLHASHDNFHASIPLEDIRGKGLLIYRLADAPLTKDNGGPFRFYILDHASCRTDDIDECANVKFVDHIELTIERGFDNRPQDEEQHAKLHGHE